MKTLALDLSTRTGWAVFDNEKPIVWGVIEHRIDDFKRPAPFNYIQASKQIRDDILSLVKNHELDRIVIESTVQGKASFYSQALLHYLHAIIALTLDEQSEKVEYISPSTWRQWAGVSISSDSKRKNIVLVNERNAALAAFVAKVTPDIHEEVRREYGAFPGAKAMDVRARAFEELIEAESKRFIRSWRGTIADKKAHKTTLKHVAISRVKELFGLQLTMEQNDIADALLLGWGYNTNKLKQGDFNGTEARRTEANDSSKNECGTNPDAGTRISSNRRNNNPRAGRKKGRK